MDESVLRAMAKWPNVPAVYGWLSLDRRGRWRLRDETIGNVAANAFISRNYACDERGRWYFQNGPQRVFVALAYTPWVYRLDGMGLLCSHTDAPARTPERAWFDEDGNLLLLTEHGIGLLDDRDLPQLLEQACDARATLFDDAELEVAIEGLYRQGDSDLHIKYQAELISIDLLHSSECPDRFSYIVEPTDVPAEPVQNSGCG